MTKVQATTRDRLIEAAIDLFYEKGIQWVSFQQIATQVGITQAGLYKHFADKDDLLKACGEKCAESARKMIDDLIDKASGPLEKNRAYVQGNFEWQAKHRKEAVIILSLYYFGFNSKPIQELLLSINRQAVNRVWMRLIESGVYKQNAKAKAANAARILHDLVLAELIKAVHEPRAMKPDERTKLVWQAFEATL